MAYISVNESSNKTKESLIHRRLCIILLLVMTRLTLKDVLNLTVFNLIELANKGSTLYKTENFSKKVEIDYNDNAGTILKLVKAVCKDKENDYFAFTTLYNNRKPLYASNVRKELIVMIYNILEETESEVNLTYLITEKIIT